MTDSDSPGPAKRQRAPTITIDTSAGDQEPPPTVEDQLPPSNDGRLSLSSRSGDSHDSRPTSAHNISSTAAKPNDQSNFLAVPGSRSRANSDGSDIEAQSPTSYGGETFIAPSSTGEAQNRSADSQTNHEIVNDAEALKPDPGTEASFQVENNKFAFAPGQMSKFINPKSLSAFYAVGGLSGLEKGLRTNVRSGLSSDETHLEGTISFEEAKAAANATSSAPLDAPPLRSDSGNQRIKSKEPSSDAFSDRKRVFKDNRLPEKKPKSIFELAWIAYNDKVLILLSICAVVSLGLGFYEAFGQKHEPGQPRIEWVEGVAIVAAIVIVVVVGAANDWQKERQFVRLNKKKEDRSVKVIRSGKSQEISVYDVLVGDVMLLEPGDLIPVDGIFISGHNVKCDESSATGESDLLRKSPADDVFRAIESHENVKKLDPFIISGGKVAEGVGTFLVTAVGVHSSYGKTMMSLREDPESTPLQSKLNVLADQIAKLGGAAALLMFVVLFIKFLVQVPKSRATPAVKAQGFLQILIVAVTVVVVAVPEGLPLAVTLALAFATTRMLRDNNLVRLLRACETMGNATTICSDKTGTLTQNKMTVVAGTLGTSSRFGDGKPDSGNGELSPASQGKRAPSEDRSPDVSIGECVAALSDDTKEAVKDSIVINSTAFEGDENGVATFIGSKTETALLSFARDHLGMGPVSVERSNKRIVQMVPFDSGRKCMAAVIKINDGHYRMLVKGASEILLEKCTSIVRDPVHGMAETAMTKANSDSLNRIITSYATRSLRTIGLTYRDFERWPPKGAKTLDDDKSQVDFDKVFKDMVFLGVVGIQDPLRDGVKESVAKCQHAGVFVRMVTGDNLTTAKAIAEECGIYTSGGLIMEGPKFRKLSTVELDQAIPRLQVLARSSPDDKRMLVQRLKDLGETVAVTGDGTNDAPALKTADVGFSMGIAGTEVAKEASAIILMDDNFSSIVKAIMWGRAVNDAVRKFLQFQVTVNITAVVLTFVSAVASNTQSSVLSAVQLLWVNLIMDTMAALALATDPPAESILDRKPSPKSAPLISTTMWKMILGQAVYQLAVTFTLNFAGLRILSYDTDREIAQLPTLVFNTFVWMQIFNQYNNRRLDNKFNILEGVLRNWIFIGINVIMVAGQVMIIFVGGKAFGVVRLNGAQWAYSIVLGALSLPVAVVIRLIPDELLVSLLPHWWHRKSAPDLVISDGNHRYEWNQGIEDIRGELAFLKRVRGGRLNALKFKFTHPVDSFIPGSRSRSHSRSSSILPRTSTNETDGEASSPSATPELRTRRRGRSRSSSSAFGPAAAMAGVIAGSIAGWSPIELTQGDNESLKFSRDKSHAEPESHGDKEVHAEAKSGNSVSEGHSSGQTLSSSTAGETKDVSADASSGVLESHHDKSRKD